MAKSKLSKVAKSKLSKVAKSSKRRTDTCLSDLPLDVLCKIVSMLPVKQAVATTVLSRTWRHILPFSRRPYVLSFEENGNDEPASRFTQQVDGLLGFMQNHPDRPSLDRIVINCVRSHDESKIYSWIAAAVHLSVQDLKLGLAPIHPLQFGALFQRLDRWYMLKRLKIVGGFVLRVPRFALPCLETLKLYGLLFDDGVFDSAMDVLLEGCRVLKELHMRDCNFQDLKALSIHSTVLTTLRIEDCFANDGWGCLLGIDTPNLQHLSLVDCYASGYCICELQFLQDAHIHVGATTEFLEEEELEPHYADVNRIIEACCVTSTLLLGACSFQAVQYNANPLPIFKNLKDLRLGMLGGPFAWQAFGRILQSVPCLEVLKFDEGITTDCRMFFDDLEGVVLPPKLRMVSLMVFHEEDYFIKLIEFLLRGKGLQSLYLYCLPLKEVSVFNALVRLPESSKICWCEKVDVVIVSDEDELYMYYNNSDN